MYKFILLLMCFCFILFTNAYSTPPMMSDGATINGYVMEKEHEETLISATVYIEGTKKGTFTNKSGYYSITDLPEGEYTIKVSMIGYKTHEEKIKVTKRQSIRKDFRLVSVNVLTDEVVVEADKEVETRHISISKVNVPVNQIKEIRIGGESDVFRSLQMLPGVLTSSQLSSGLYIRGGSPDQNLILLDGSTVYNPSHLFGFISTFNTDAIKDVELIKGGYPAQYGSRMSSVINITQKDGNRNEFEGLASLGLISSKLSLEGPFFNGSWFIGGRRTYFDLIKGFMDTDPKNPLPDFGFYDINAKVTQDITKNDKFFLSGFLSKDNFDYSGSGLGVNLSVGNKAGSFKWTHIWGDNLFSTFNLTGSEYKNGMETDFSGYKLSFNNSIVDYTVKTTTEWFATDILNLTGGIEISNFIFKYVSNFSGDGKESQQGTNKGGRQNLLFQDWTYNAFTEINHRITDLLSFQLGLRVGYWDMSRYINWDPRFSVRYQFQDNIALKGSWGIFHQYLRLSGDENFSLFDTWLPTDNSVKPSRADHFILSFETKPEEDVDFNFDVYYKKLYNISETIKYAMEGSAVKDVFFSGKGEAYGCELFLQKKVGKLAGWIGYGLGWVNATFDSINNGKPFRPKYDRRHDFKVVLQYELDESWLFGGTFMFQSGQSYTGAVSRFQPGMPGDDYGYGRVISSERYGLRMPPSHQLNLSATYRTTLFDLPFKIILDIFNVYNRKDILMRYYDTHADITEAKDVKLLPIIPTISCEIKF